MERNSQNIWKNFITNTAGMYKPPGRSMEDRRKDDSEQAYRLKHVSENGQFQTSLGTIEKCINCKIFYLRQIITTSQCEYSYFITYILHRRFNLYIVFIAPLIVAAISLQQYRQFQGPVLCFVVATDYRILIATR